MLGGHPDVGRRAIARWFWFITAHASRCGLNWPTATVQGQPGRTSPGRRSEGVETPSAFHSLWSLAQQGGECCLVCMPLRAAWLCHLVTQSSAALAALPVLGRLCAPFAHLFNVIGFAPVARPDTPLLLAHCFADLLTLSFRAEFLVIKISRVGNERSLAARTSGVVRLELHANVSRSSEARHASVDARAVTTCRASRRRRRHSKPGAERRGKNGDPLRGGFPFCSHPQLPKPSLRSGG